MIVPKKYCDYEGDIFGGVEVMHKGKVHTTGNRRHFFRKSDLNI